MHHIIIILLASLIGVIQPAYIYAQEISENEQTKQGQCNGAKQDSDELIDLTYQYINETFCVPAAWFDGFFATDRIDEEVRPGSHVRWTNDFIQPDGGDFDYVTKVRASLRLPKASKKLKLLFEGEQEESLEDAVPANEEDVKTDIGVLYELLRSPRANLNLKLNLSPKLSLRYRYAYPFTDTFLTRFTQVFFRADGDYGSETRLEFEKRMNENVLLRWTNIIEDTHSVSGTTRTSALVLFQKLSDISALSYESSVIEQTIPETYNTNARIGIRYRRNFYRKWLFYELAPEVTWPREIITDERQQIAAFLFRLEINFINM